MGPLSGYCFLHRLLLCSFSYWLLKIFCEESCILRCIIQLHVHVWTSKTDFDSPAWGGTCTQQQAPALFSQWLCAQWFFFHHERKLLFTMNIHFLLTICHHENCLKLANFEMKWKIASTVESWYLDFLTYPGNLNWLCSPDKTLKL